MEVYMIKNCGYEDRVLDLSRTDDRTVLGWEDNGGGNQKWRLERHTNNTYLFRNLDGNYLGEDAGRERPLGVKDSFMAVGYRVESAGNDMVHIGVFGHDLLFDLGADKIVRLKPANGSRSQMWKKMKMGK